MFIKSVFRESFETRFSGCVERFLCQNCRSMFVVSRELIVVFVVCSCRRSIHRRVCRTQCAHHWAVFRVANRKYNQQARLVSVKVAAGMPIQPPPLLTVTQTGVGDMLWWLEKNSVLGERGDLPQQERPHKDDSKTASLLAARPKSSDRPV